jgi:hypothetical protein
MAFKNTLILRKPRSGCLEGRTAPGQLIRYFSRTLFCRKYESGVKYPFHTRAVVDQRQPPSRNDDLG